MSRTLGSHCKSTIIMALGLALIAVQAFADEVRPAYLELNAQSDNSFNIVWKQPVVENRRLPIDPIFPRDCELHETSPPELTGTALLKRWQTNCDLSQADIEIVGLHTSITDVMVRYIEADGTINTYMVRPADPILRLGSANTDSVGYLMIGIEHLIGGIDHVLFVIGLVLFIRSPWMLLKTITAFTLAHSITLALSILGIVSLPQAPVEAVIALSIVFLARELAQSEEQRSALTRSSPWLVAFAFGLLHGLGFAGVLREIGLPEDALFSSLLLFNVGIEIGQIIVVGILIFALWLWRKVSDGLSLSPRLLNSSAAYVMGSVAMYWSIDRTLLLF